MTKTTKQKARENLKKRMEAEEGDFRIVRKKGKRKRITKKPTKK